MRAYAKVANGRATVYIPATSNRVPLELERPARFAKAGWYRASVTYEGGWLVDMGKPVEPVKEAKRLRRLVEGNTGQARTGSPGIAGYQQMADAATAAKATQRQVSAYFAKLLEDAGRGGDNMRAVDELA